MADIKLSTNFNTTGLADFTNADPQKLLEYVILEGKGIKDYFDFETGVKFQTKIPFVTNADVDVSTGALAGYNTGSGQTVVKDVVLTDTQLKIFETYTKEQLNRTILALLGKKGSDPSELPVEDVVMKLKGKTLHLYNEKLLCQGRTDGSTGTAGAASDYHFWYIDGIVKQIKGVAGAYANPAVEFSTLSDASILQQVKKFVDVLGANMPQLIMKPDLRLCMSPENFQSYARALYNLNGSITTLTLNVNGTSVETKGNVTPVETAQIPGTNIEAVSTIGLNGVNDIFLTYPENIIAVYDLESEEEQLNMIYNPYQYWHQLAGLYKIGVKVVDPSMCVLTTGA
jgi:hypothetical protein